MADAAPLSQKAAMRSTSPSLLGSLLAGTKRDVHLPSRTRPSSAFVSPMMGGTFRFCAVTGHVQLSPHANISGLRGTSLVGALSAAGVVPDVEAPSLSTSRAPSLLITSQCPARRAESARPGPSHDNSNELERSKVGIFFKEPPRDCFDDAFWYPSEHSPMGLVGPVTRGSSVTRHGVRNADVAWAQEKRWLKHAIDDLVHTTSGDAFADRP
eukprot:CAMPEP_0117545186 /NCGR_PEP_ID=MMETSP0784-20121206/45965_1 /TAXON_ID=39447 /ORGANISM="" /LENGTH=211 /DNA_ID=CAMNT_0005342025 /DNA_START=32 /DNA_END=663 /DNA_ORIENTATION=+